MSNEKYIDLIDRIGQHFDAFPREERRAGMCDALNYLDWHPGVVPGRTITESEHNDDE